MVRSFSHLLILFLVLSIPLFAQKAYKDIKVQFPFYIYSDYQNEGNHFFPSGWMGDYADLTFDEGWTGNPKAGKNCIRITYSAGRGGWAGAYWQNPPGNWGGLDGGYNLTGAKSVSFWARGERGDEVVRFKVGGSGTTFSDSCSVESRYVTLGKKWTYYSIDLRGQNLSYLLGPFCVLVDAEHNENGAVVYLDEIKFSDDSEINNIINKNQ